MGENWERGLKKLQIQKDIKVSLFPSIKGSLYGTVLHFFSLKGHHGGRDHVLPLCLKGHPKGELNHICPLEGQGRRHFIRLVH